MFLDSDETYVRSGEPNTLRVYVVVRISIDGASRILFPSFLDPYMRHYCTYFDNRYLAKGLVTLKSLLQHDPECHLWVLALDDQTLHFLRGLALPYYSLVSLAELETFDSELKRVRASRTMIEYYFTLTPCLPLFLLRTNPAIEMLTYIDADLFFCSNPDSLYRELGDSSVGLVRHNYCLDLLHMEAFGVHNVCWIMFRRDGNALACLNWYRLQCLAWCEDRLENDRFADQKYLDQFAQQFSGVATLSHKGANVASWNIDNDPISHASDGFRVGSEPIIFFHFHGLSFAHGHDPLKLAISEKYLVDRNNPVHKLCRTYLSALQSATELLMSHGICLADPLRGVHPPLQLLE